MLTYDLGQCGDEPKYQYLFKMIRRDILDGKILPGERLPSKRALAANLNVGVITVANAYDQLAAEGFVSAEERRGYFVQDLSDFEIGTRKPAEEEPEIEEKPAEERDRSVDLNANRVNLKLFPVSRWNQLMRKTLYQSDAALYQTVPFNGLYELRRAIADYLHDYKLMDVDPANIIIGAGTEYLYGRITQMFGRAYTFGFEDPGYKKLATIVSTFGNPCEFIPVDAKGLMVSRLEDSAADVVHVSPANHFPTGSIMSVKRRAELLEWACRAKKRYIIEDDYDSEFRYKGTSVLPLFSIDTHDKVIYINTFSKTMVPALRISYMVLPHQLIKRYKETMSFYSCTVSSFEQQTLARFISEGYFERHINRLRTYYSSLRKKVLEAVKHSKIGSFSTVIEHGSGTHFLLDVRTSLTEEEIMTAAKALDVSVQTLSDYSMGETDMKLHRMLVVNYAGLTADSIPTAIAKLEKIFPEAQ